MEPLQRLFQSKVAVEALVPSAIFSCVVFAYGCVLDIVAAAVVVVVVVLFVVDVVVVASVVNPQK